MKLKKVLALVLAMVMTIALVACGNKNEIGRASCRDRV